MENERVINVRADLPFKHLKDSVMGTGAVQQKMSGRTRLLCGTFFEGSHLTTKQIFHLSYLWAHRSGKYEEMEFQTD